MIILQCISDGWIAAHFCLWEYVKILIASCSVFFSGLFLLAFKQKNPKQNQPNKKAKGAILEWEK